MLSRVLVSWRLLATGLAVTVVGLGGLAASVEQQQSARTLQGSVDEADLAAHHAAGDVFALPCRTRGWGLDVEGLGIALLEASASGLPVVAGRSGGAPETVQDGRTGHIVDGRDRQALVEALAALLADPGRAAALGAAGRAWMRAEWGWSTRAARLSALLDGDRSRAAQAGCLRPA